MKMSRNHTDSVLNSKILACHFQKLCEEFSPPYKDDNARKNRQILNSNNEMIYFLSQIVRLVKEGKVNSEIFKNDISKVKNLNDLHMEILWYLEVCKIIPLTEFIQYHQSRNHKEVIQYMAQQIIGSILVQQINQSKLRSEMIIACTKAVFESIDEKLNKENSLYQTILNLISSNLQKFYKCDEMFEEKNIDILKLAELLDQSEVNCDNLKLFFIQLLKSLMEDSLESLQLIFMKQEKIKANFKDHKIVPFFNTVSKYCEHNELVTQLEVILMDTSKGINWDNMFCFITFLGGSIKDGWASLRKICNSLIKVSFEKLDERLLSYAFLIARQGCFEKSNCFFPSYVQWFSTVFSADSKTPINTKKISIFFFDFLSDLVPFDSTYYSKVHINRLPSIPPQCQSYLSNYVTLVKSHLCDLDISIELGICHNTTNKRAAEYDVENVLKHFERTNEILNSVFQAAMFCREYFEKKFLVELLSKFEGKKSTRHKFIMKLNSAGRIPSSMFKTYKSMEKKK